MPWMFIISTAIRYRKPLIALLVFLIFFFALAVMIPAALLNKTMLQWPVDAPVSSSDTAAYIATGWTVSSPFGWRDDPDSTALRYTMHEGIDLVGDMFCLGCEVPPNIDVRIPENGVHWDQPNATNPLDAGAGVVLTMEVQNARESGMLLADGTEAPMYIEYGHLQPYRVYVRTQSCQRRVGCPNYENDGAGSVALTCPGRVYEVSDAGGEREYAYASPGECKAVVSWPDDYTPEGGVELRFDQQIVPGETAQDASLTFRATRPAPPQPTPDPALPPPLFPAP